MKRTRANRADVTPELTGTDASMDEAESGDAGNGVGLYGGDLSGVEDSDAGLDEQGYRLESDPGRPNDISPNQIGYFDKALEEDDTEENSEITARPTHPRAVSPGDTPVL